MDDLDYLLGRVEIPDILINPGIHRLTVLPGGKAVSNSAELLGSPKLEALVEEMKNRYREDRVVILDTPALLLTSDAVTLSEMVDGILLVVEAERTTPDYLKRAMALLDGRPILGTVMNKAKT